MHIDRTIHWKNRFPNAVAEVNDLDRSHRDEPNYLDHLQELDCIHSVSSHINPQPCARVKNPLQQGLNPRGMAPGPSYGGKNTLLSV